MGFEIKDDHFYTLKDLEKLGIATIICLRRWIKEKKLKGTRVGAKYFVLGSDLRAFLLKGTKSS